MTASSRDALHAGWRLRVATINPNRIQMTKREKLSCISESAVALNDYWTKGVAVRGVEGVVKNDPAVEAPWRYV